MAPMPRVLIYAENSPQPQQEAYEKVYPEGIGLTLARAFETRGIPVRVVSTSDPECGMTEAALDETDVLVYWSHKGDHLVPSEVTDRLHDRVLRGMGLIVLHSAMGSDIFRRLMGTDGKIFYRNFGERERMWVVDPHHPIAEGIGPYIELELEEMYSEPFGIPQPDELVFLSWFEGGEVFRSGCCWKRGKGRVFYLRCGHETMPSLHNEQVHRVLYNAVNWAMPVDGIVPTRDHEGVTRVPEGPYTDRFDEWIPPTGPARSSTR